MSASTLALTGRSLKLVPRVLSTFVPSLVFPIIFLVAFNGAFGKLVLLPGFPVRSMIDWLLPMTVVQGASFAGVTVAVAATRDIESGFFDRLLLAPSPRSSLIAGAMITALLRGLVSVPVIVGLGLLAGAHVPGGLPGVLALGAAAGGCAVLAAAWGLGLAFRFRTQQIAPLIQIPVFISVFLSTAQVPLQLMSGWLHAVARVNPMTNVLALARDGFIGPATWEQAWPGLIVLVVGVALLAAFAGRGLQRYTL
jgi:ABC-2 type transport system permease protein